MDLSTLTPGTRLMADVRTFAGISRECVRVERVLDIATVLVTVESALGTPAEIMGATLPIDVSALAETPGAGEIRTIREALAALGLDPAAFLADAMGGVR